MPGRRCACALLLILSAGSPVRASAQVEASGDVPMELALTLLAGNGADVSIHVGALPPDLQGRLPLGPVERVVGALVRRGGGTVVVETAGGPADALSRYRDHLREEGWERPPEPGWGSGGFAPTRRFGRDFWCGDGFFLDPSGLAFDTGTYLRIRYSVRGDAPNVCDPAEREDPRFGRLMELLPLPTLEAPRGAEVRSTGGGGSGGERESEAEVRSSLTTEQIFQHYAEQLTAAGWVPAGAAGGEGMSAGRWLAEDDDGRPLVGILAVWSLGDPGLHTAWMRVGRAEGRMGG